MPLPATMRLAKIFKKTNAFLHGAVPRYVTLDATILLEAFAGFLALALLLTVSRIRGKTFDLAIYALAVSALPLALAYFHRNAETLSLETDVATTRRSSLWLLTLAILILPALFFDFSLDSA